MRLAVGPAPSSLPGIHPALLFLMTAFLGLQPLSTDLYLPSLPAIGAHFGETPVAVQSTLSVFVAMFAFGQLLVGPMSDRFGRRPVVITGLLLYLAGSLGGTFAPSLSWLVFARLVQAIGMCGTVLCARAIIRDLYEPEAGSRVMARALGWMTAVTLLGPIVGGTLQTAFGWRAAFAALALIAMVLVAASAVLLPESNAHRNRAATQLRPLLGNYAMIARSPIFRAYAATVTSSYCCLFTFISGSSLVLIQVLGLSPAQYGIAFGVVTIGFLPGTLLARFLQPRLGLRGTAAAGGTLMLTAGVTIAALAAAGVQTVAAVVVPMFFVLMAHGILQPTCQMGAISPFPRNAGAAAALLGFAMHLMAALLGWGLGASQDGTTLPLALTELCAAAVTAAFGLRLLRGPR